MSDDETPNVKSDKGKLAEMFLTKRCERAFLKLWAYPNPYKSQGDELCDLLAVFEEHIFIFSIKNISFTKAATTEIAWKRWKKTAIDKSIRQVKTAERLIRSHPENIFLDAKCTKKFPIPIDTKNWKFHKIVVALGAEEACKNDSPDNINGSLAICYNDLENPKKPVESPGPFHLTLPRDEVIHVFDSHNLEIILSELDTVRDLLLYFEEKEKAVKKYDTITYFGEEELLAHYFSNFDKEDDKYSIGTKDKQVTCINLKKGFWQGFKNLPQYQKRKQANEISYTWDMLLQKTFQHALDGTLKGNGNAFKGHSPSVEMVKEPRVSRRMLSEILLGSIQEFSTRNEEGMRHATYSLSYYDDLMYVFFQLSLPPNMDYEKEYRPLKREFLDIACGVLKNKFPKLKKVIGITVDLPELNQHISEDFILKNCEDWTEEIAEHYRKANKETGLNIFESNNQRLHEGIIHEFPQ